MAIKKLVHLMENTEQQSVQLSAANSLLDRGWGRPTQPLAADTEGPPVGIAISREELAEQTLRELDEAFCEWRPQEPAAVRHWLALVTRATLWGAMQWIVRP